MQLMFDLIMGLRVIGPIVVVALLFLFFYHLAAWHNVHTWKKECNKMVALNLKLVASLDKARAENQRLNSKLNSAKSRVRRMRKATRRRKERSDEN